MSIDIQYYSFSPSRADPKWPAIAEDLPVLRELHAPSKDYWERKKRGEEEGYAIHDSFEPALKELRQKIYDHFGKQGYYIPWVDWDKEVGTDRTGFPGSWNDEAKIDYLLNYGPVYQKGADLKQKNVNYLVLRVDAPELEKEYLQKIQERNNAVQKASAVTGSSENEHISLTDQQRALDEADLDYLIYQHKYDEQQLLLDLIRLDLYYGAVDTGFEDPNVEYFYLEALAAACTLKTEEVYPTKEEWIRLYHDITPQQFRAAAESVAKELDWEQEEAMGALREFLLSAKYIVQDLSEKQDSVFVVEVNGEIAPPNAERFFTERARIHAKHYRGIAPPVW